MHDVHPFGAAHDSRLVVSTRARQEMLARLIDGLGRGEPFIVLIGEAGTGKSSLIAQAREAWTTRGPVIALDHPSCSADETLDAIGTALDSTPAPDESRAQRIGRVREALAALAAMERVAVLIVEDAQDVSDDVLDVLRHVATTSDGRSALQVVLTGSPELERRLASPELAALQQRVAFRGRLEGLSRKETRRYVQERVSAAGGNGPARFPNDTCREIWTLTHGVPRAINTLASEALRIAEAASAQVVSAEHAHQAAVALWGVAPAPPARAESAPAPAPVREAPVAETPAHDAPTANDASEAPALRASEAATPVPHDDPSVRAWVSKFAGDGPPRIGARLLAEALQPSDEAVSSLSRRQLPPIGSGSFEAAPEWDPEALALLEKKRKAARRRPRRNGARHPAGMNATSVVLIVLVVVAAAAAVLFLPRLRSLALAFHPAATAPADSVKPDAATSAPAAAVAPTTTVAVRPLPRPHRSVPVSAPAAVPTTTPATGGIEPAPAGSAPVASAPADSTPKPHRTTLEVASYLSVDRAEIERDRLIAATGLDGWVVTGTEDGTDVYRVLIGIFSTPQRAESAAGSVLNQGLVTQARVVPLPPKRLRH